MQTLLQLRGLLQRLSGLGLTQREYADARDRMLAELLPPDGSLPVASLSKLINIVGEPPTRRLGTRW